MVCSSCSLQRKYLPQVGDPVRVCDDCFSSSSTSSFPSPSEGGDIQDISSSPVSSSVPGQSQHDLPALERPNLPDLEFVGSSHHNRCAYDCGYLSALNIALSDERDFFGCFLRYVLLL
eukprot:TRINITY_DN3438_c0_g1_i1.p1 TRINITY_DN3438_c0_g1~~TRINITY_DN3438_c0_g1_i1.p1  ORF type:complete len:118 (-),score=13.87 TRINITY_DN3438_c0_g1_i1:74-427(-)